MVKSEETLSYETVVRTETLLWQSFNGDDKRDNAWLPYSGDRCSDTELPITQGNKTSKKKCIDLIIEKFTCLKLVIRTKI